MWYVFNLELSSLVIPSPKVHYAYVFIEESVFDTEQNSDLSPIRKPCVDALSYGQDPIPWERHRPKFIPNVLLRGKIQSSWPNAQSLTNVLVFTQSTENECLYLEN